MREWDRGPGHLTDALFSQVFRPSKANRMKWPRARPKSPLSPTLTSTSNNPSPPPSTLLPSLSQLDPDVLASLPLGIRKELELEYRKEKNEYEKRRLTSLPQPPRQLESDTRPRQRTLQEIGCVSKANEKEDGGRKEDESAGEGEGLFRLLDGDLLLTLPSQIIEENLRVEGHGEAEIQKALQKRRIFKKKSVSEEVDGDIGGEGNAESVVTEENDNPHDVSQMLFFQTEKIDMGLRSLMKQWMEQIKAPSIVDQTIISLFLHQLILEKNLEGLQRVLRFLCQFSREYPQWAEGVENITKDIQKRTLECYQCTFHFADEL